LKKPAPGLSHTKLLSIGIFIFKKLSETNTLAYCVEAVNAEGEKVEPE
jgi:hypothetical protein